MRKSILLLSLLSLACGGSDHGINTPPAKPDPFITIRMRNQLDTTTAVGRADWHTYALLTGPYDALNGITFTGSISLQDVRLHHDVQCMDIGADSVGQRLVSAVALADTTTEALTPDATAQSIIEAWYGGNHTLPSGWKALSVPPTDAWQSTQYEDGHGLVRSDPIKWSWDWSAAGTTTFYERSDTDTMCNSF